jgi:hypothetical protein
MDINEAYELLRYIVNKTQGGHMPPALFNRVIRSASEDLFNSLLPGNFLMSGRRKYEETQKISDSLSPFKKMKDLMVDTYGKGLYPVDYAYLSSIRKVVTTNNVCDEDEREIVEKPVRVMDDDKLAHILSSKIVGPSIKKMKFYASQYDTFWQFWPKNIQVVRFTYLCFPTPPVYAFTMTNNRPVYDEGNSVQFQWRATEHNEIVIRAAKIVGINLREQELIQFAEQQKSEIVQ